jgi:beta-lactamase superfamily II metal-dependent hydrolase
VTCLLPVEIKKMRVRFYQVECGDAASIMYEGDDGKRHHIFIDAGYERTYRDVLAYEIKAIEAAGEQIDLWLISHIHDDHIGGVISYIKAIQKAEVRDIVSQWWFNPPYPDLPNYTTSSPVSEARSFSQGDVLTKYLWTINKLPSGKIIAGYPNLQLGGLNIKPLSPTENALAQLEEKYQQHYLRNMSYELLTEVSEPQAARVYDYRYPLDSLLYNRFVEDSAIENVSSITALTTFAGKSVLWMADITPSALISGLKALGKSFENPLAVDLVKVSHHGSRGNNNDELYRLIRCSKFLISANGMNKHCLPSKECIARILNSTNRLPGETIDLYFTYDNDYTRQIFDIDGPSIFDKWNFRMIFPNNEKWVDIILT